MVVDPRRFSANALLIPSLLATMVVTLGCPGDPVVPPPPAAPLIMDFTVDKGEVGTGESVTFTWKTENATSVSITAAGTELHKAEGSSAASGTHSVAIQTGGTYVLTAEGNGKKDGARLAIVVRNAPTVVEFTATPDEVLAGGESVLRWKVNNGSRLELKTQAGMSILTETDASLIADGSKRVVVTADTVFILEVKNAAGTQTESLPVNILRPARITEFGASPTTINVGETSTLSWVAIDAVSVTITANGDPVTIPSNVNPNNGSVSVTPTVATDYVLTAVGRGGNADRQLSVAVRPPPMVDSFELAPESITLGIEAATLTWETTNATSVEIRDQNDNLVDLQGAGPDDSADVAPTAPGTYTYRLRAIGPGGEALSELRTLTVVDPTPIIDTFTASSATVTRDGTVTLSWTTTNAASVSLSDGTTTYDLTGKSVDDSIVLTMSTVGTFDFVLSAANSEGTIVNSPVRTVTVNPPAPVITAWASTKEGVTLPGESFELSWTTTDATSVSVTENDGSSSTTIVTAGAPSGTHTVTPIAEGTYTYVLTATGPTSPDATSTTITVTASNSAPAASSFDTSSSQIVRGATVTLTWTATDASRYLVKANGVTVYDGPNLTAQHTPTTNDDVVYELTVIGLGGERVHPTTQTVIVDPPAPTITAFTASTATADRDAPVTFTWTAAEADTLELSDGTTSYDVSGLTTFDVTHTVEATYSYTLTARNTASTGVQSVTSSPVDVTVVQPDPSVATLTATPDTLNLGGSVTIAWTTKDVDAIELSDGEQTIDVSGKNPAGDSITLTPDSNGLWIYTLTAKRAGADDGTGSVTVTVNAAAPTFARFDIAPRVVTAGDSNSVTWATTNTDDVYVTPYLRDPARTFRQIPGSPFEDIATSGTVLNDASGAAFSGDETLATLTFPTGFAYPFFGRPYTEVKVSANGVLGFGDSYSGLGNNAALMTATTPLRLIAPFWDDLKAFSGTSRVLYSLKDTGTAEERLIVQFDRFGLYESGSTPSNEITMQVALYRAGDVEFRYKTLRGLRRTQLTGGSATIGLQGPTADLGYQYSFNTANQLSEGRSLRILQQLGGPSDESVPDEIVLSQTADVRLLAVGFNGSQRSAPINVRVVAPPVADSFNVDRSRVGAGNAAILSWSSTDATEWKILADGIALTGVPQSASGTLTVNPTATTEYAFIAKNDADAAAERRRTVTVAAPVIASFNADEALKHLGESATFTWSTEGAESLTLTTDTNVTISSLTDPAGRAEIASGTATHVTESGAHVYTLTLTNGSGTVTDTVTVESTSEPRGVSFATTASRVTTGRPLTLEWTTINADRLEILEVANCGETTGRGVLDTSDSARFDPGSVTEAAPALIATADVFYKLIVHKAPSAPHEVCTSIRVLAEPAITSTDFSPNPSYVGSTTTLWWTAIAEDVARVRIVRPDGAVVADDLPSSGSHELVLFNATENFVFQAFNEFGVQSANHPMTVTLVVPPPFFTVKPGNAIAVKYSATDIRPASSTLNWRAENVQTVEVIPPVRSDTLTADFIDVSTPSNRLLFPNDDDSYVDLTIPTAAGFKFRFMGQEYETARLSTNGYVTFDLVKDTFASGNLVMPNTSTTAPTLIVAPFWDDLDKTPTAGSGIYFAIAGTVPGERMAIVQWKHYRPWTSTTETVVTDLNFQVQLHENGDVRFAYGNMVCGTMCGSASRHTGSSATIGLYNGLPGSDARYQLVGFNTTGAIQPNTSVVFTAAQPFEGQISVAASDTTTFDFIAKNDTSVANALGRVTVVAPFDLVISEFMADPLGDDTNKEWFEVRNLTAVDIDVRGLTLGTDNAVHVVNAEDEIILPGSSSVKGEPYIVFGQSSDTLINGGIGVKYAYGSSPESGLVLDNSLDAISISSGTHVFDTVGYNTDPSLTRPWNIVEGRSTQLHPGLAQQTTATSIYPRIHELGDDSRTWCLSASGASGIDPTPGTVNATCAYSVQKTTGASFTSIRSTGTQVIPTTNSTGAAVAVSHALPFTWTYLGRPTSAIHVARYGYVSLVANNATFPGTLPSTSGALSSNAEMPSGPLATSLSEMVAPFWRLMTRNTLTGKTPMVVAQTLGTAPNRSYVIEWVDHYPTSGANTDTCEFQLQLHEAGGFSFHYGTLVGARSSLEYGTFGFQGFNAQFGHTLGHNTLAAGAVPRVEQGDVFTFTPVP